MKKLGSVLLAGALASWANVACADDFDTEFQPHHYWGLGYSYYDVGMDLAGNSYSFDNGMVGAIVGYQFHKSFALDLRGYGNVNKDELDTDIVEVKRTFSLLGRGILPVDKNIKFYGLLGIGDSQMSFDSPLGTIDDLGSDIQYGIGMSINKGGQLDLQVEWMNMYNKDFVNIEGINVNIVYNL